MADLSLCTPTKWQIMTEPTKHSPRRDLIPALVHRLPARLSACTSEGSQASIHDLPFTRGTCDIPAIERVERAVEPDLTCGTAIQTSRSSVAHRRSWWATSAHEVSGNDGMRRNAIARRAIAGRAKGDVPP